MTAGPYSIGSRHWPGLAKAAEECGEVVQVAAKIIAAGGAGSHWDGTDLTERLEDEIADARATMQFLVAENGLDAQRMADRTAAKLALFRRWHAQHLDGTAQVTTEAAR